MVEKRDVQNLLIELGASPSLLGFGYTVEAVKYYEPGMLVTGELYPKVAEKFVTSAHNVERVIGHLIKHIFDRLESDKDCRMFGNAISPKTKRPTNAEFIAILQIRSEERREERSAGGTRS